MLPSHNLAGRVRFACYELELETGLLRKNGRPLKLQRQPAQILALLIKNAGSVVTREAIRAHVWGDGTFVDFEHGLNSAIKKIREVLNDSADEPRYIQTLPKVGYRFLVEPEFFPLTTQQKLAPVAVLPLPAERGVFRRYFTNRSAAVAVLVLISVAAVASALWLSRRSITKIDAPVRFSLTLPPHLSFDNVGFTGSPLAFSPDGSEIVVAAREGKVSRLYRRRLRDADFEPVAGTERARAPVYSADGRWLVFADAGVSQLKRVPLGGGVAEKLYSAEITFFGLSLASDGRLFFGECGKGLSCRRTDGTVQRLSSTTTDPNEWGGMDTEHCYPELLPGGGKIVYTGIMSFDASALRSYDFATRTHRTILKPGVAARFLPRTGHLVYAWKGDLYSAPFDSRSATLTGKPTVALRGVTHEVQTGAAHYAIASNGSLAYIPGTTVNSWGPRVWTNAKGEIDDANKLPYYLNNPRISPDGRRIAFMDSSGDEGGRSIWVYEIATGVRKRLTDHRGNALAVAWLPDSVQLIVNASRGGSNRFHLYRIRADGSGELTRLSESDADAVPGSASPDGRWLVFTSKTHTASGDGFDLRILDLAQPGSGSRPFILTGNTEALPEFSPDGRWVAFVTNRFSPELNVAVCRADDPRRVWKISEDGATEPVWSRDGRRLFFRDLSGGRIMSRSFKPDGATPAIGSLTHEFQGPFFPGSIQARVWDIHPDGNRFLFARLPEKRPWGREVAIILNWDGTLGGR